MFRRFKDYTLIAAAIILIWAVPANANVQTMTVSEVHPGMTGIGKTVISGTEIREFNIEVIDVFTNMGFDGGPLILVKMWGDVIDASGGIAGGYSGSPVYINGKLIGAISWGPYFTQGDVAGITPIDNMLRAFTYPTEEPTRITMDPTCLVKPVQVAGRTFDSVLMAENMSNAENLDVMCGGNTLILTPCQTPLFVSGVSERGLQQIREFAAERLPYLDIIAGPGGSSGQGVPILLGPTVIEPGSSIGAQLASGDLNMTAVGTLTWVADDGRFLAFGHPFLADGETNMPFLTTKVIYTMPALDRSYKLGEPLEIIGTITQDRMTCIAGQLREQPDMVDFSLVVEDHDVGRTRRFNFSVINKEEWLPFLGWLIPMDGLVFTSDRTGEATCRASFSIYGEGLEKPVTRENLYYSSYSASESLNEFNEAMYMLTSSNPYREVRITRVEINVEITSARQTMDIIRARFNNAPNMGPGAIGYSGPAEMDDKAAKDDAINSGQMDAAIPEFTQDYPTEEEMMGYMGEMAMNTQPMANYSVTSQLVAYHPGDTIKVLVTLRPYREEPVEHVVELRIPEDFPLGQTTLDVMGGYSSYYSYYYYTDPMYSYYPMDMYSTGQDQDLDKIIDDFMQRKPNNSIVLRLTQLGPTDPYYYLQDNFEMPEEVSSVYPMEDVIYGYFSLPIEIIGEQTEPLSLDTAYLPAEQIEPPAEPETRSNRRNPYRH